jgi:hypothetical protein
MVKSLTENSLGHIEFTTGDLDPRLLRVRHSICVDHVKAEQTLEQQVFHEADEHGHTGCC